MGKEDKKEPFLENLGRATMRGLRKCKKCGTLNGTRGFSCKNKLCDVIFKESDCKKKPSTEPFRIITGNDSQIFSVRVRDKGPDYRSFVILPNLPNEAKMLLEDDYKYNINSSTLIEAGAKCYVESCSKLNGYVVNHSTVCSHLKSASMCYKSAQPLKFESSVLNDFPVSSEIKHELYELFAGTSGPLVQRISKQLFVVKCLPNSIHQLGYLHFTFSSNRSKKEGEIKFYCSCRNVKNHTSKETPKKCIHFYACCLVFSSDDRLSEEFSFFIDLIRKPQHTKLDASENPAHSLLLTDSDEDLVESCIQTNTSTIQEVDSNPHADLDERSFLILNDTSTGHPCQVEVEVVKEDDILKLPLETNHHNTSGQDNLEIQLQSENGLQLRTSDGGTISVHQLPENISLSGIKRKQDDIVQASSALLTLHKSSAQKRIEDQVGIGKKIMAKKQSLDNEYEQGSLTFISWLASVVERMNQTMHYGFSGKPEPIVFHLPKMFFAPLLERIQKCLRLRKGKMSEETQNFERKEAVPLGEFTKHTWRLTSLAHVERVFDNHLIPLEIVKHFNRELDGSFISCPRPSSDALGIQLVRSHEFKTVLRIGGKEPQSPFVIEWIPDILPLMQIGELRIRFEYDHYCNGQIVPPKPLLLSPVNTPPVKTSLKIGQMPIAPRPPPPSSHKFSFSLPTNNENVLSFPIPSDSISSGESITLLTF